MNKLKITGTQRIIDQDIPIIEGGFGEGQKCILAKTIAAVHEVKLKFVNQLINKNIDEFEFGIDILDIKTIKKFEVDSINHGIFTQNAVNRANNIYLLSEQGYFLLVSFMKTEIARIIRKQMRREYFQMREQIREIKTKEYSQEDIMMYQLQEQKKIKLRINDIENKIDDLPLLAADSAELTTAAKRKVVALLGGKGSNAYKKLAPKAFKSMYKELHENFDVNKICSIKRKDLNLAKEVVASYRLPICLAREIDKANNQMMMEGM